MTTQSGNEIELLADDQRAVLDEVGGGIRSYTARGREVLDGYPAGQPSPSGRGQVLIPWPNRLEDGSYEFDGQRHQLELNEPENGNAIHGLVRWEPWTVAEREPHRVVMTHALSSQPGYPFTLELRIEYALAMDGLNVHTTATNVGESACPYGSGFHPYLTVGTETVDSVILHLPAGTVVGADERGLPLAAAPVEGTEYDFRRPRPIGSTRLDHAFTDLVREEDGIARVALGGAALAAVGAGFSAPVALPDQAQAGQRAIERGIQGDGDDHEIQLQTLRPVSPEYHRARSKGPGLSTERDKLYYAERARGGVGNELIDWSKFASRH
jgi:aldose 1-epimerase